MLCCGPIRPHRPPAEQRETEDAVCCALMALRAELRKAVAFMEETCTTKRERRQPQPLYSAKRERRR